MRKRKLNEYKKLSAHNVCTQRSLWSEWRDLNSRPYGPEPYALPNCATPRYNIYVAFASSVAFLGARRACPLGLAFFTAYLKLLFLLGFRLFCLRSYRKPNCATPRLNNIFAINFGLLLQYTSILLFLQQKQVNYLKKYHLCRYFFVAT